MASFLPAADEVWRLQRGGDEECLFFQRAVNGGKVITDNGTRQGIYVMSPSGQTLARINSLNAEKVLVMMKEGLAKWDAMPEQERWLPDGFSLQGEERWESSLPKDGLRLERIVRDIPKDGSLDGERYAKSNVDSVWFSKDEVWSILEAADAALPATSLYQIEDQWTDQTNTARTLGDFRGEVVITAMVFTHCQYACPLILQDLRGIQAQIPKDKQSDIRWLLVSMDSDRDTPEVLADYAAKNDLDPDSWTLLHGDDFAVRTIAAVLGVNYVKDSRGNFSHSNIITVLNRDGSVAYKLEGLNADSTACVQAVLEAVNAE
ncbi:MAG: SCO family protein [Planctomycetota bacterium]|nr:SCO family protein [Planctomycetota bacterium]MDA1113956.1 SCO family protein [Planctomycetota bacterium]